MENNEAQMLALGKNHIDMLSKQYKNVDFSGINDEAFILIGKTIANPPDDKLSSETKLKTEKEMYSFVGRCIIDVLSKKYGCDDLGDGLNDKSFELLGEAFVKNNTNDVDPVFDANKDKSLVPSEIQKHENESKDKGRNDIMNKYLNLFS